MARKVDLGFPGQKVAQQFAKGSRSSLRAIGAVPELPVLLPPGFAYFVLCLPLINGIGKREAMAPPGGLQVYAIDTAVLIQLVQALLQHFP